MDFFDQAKLATVALATFDESIPKSPFDVIGTGFCVDPVGIIVTCSHVLSAFMETSIERQIRDIPASEKGKRYQRGADIGLSLPHAVFFSRTTKPGFLAAIPVPVEYMVAKTDFDLAALRIGRHVGFPAGYPTMPIEDYEVLREGLDVATCGFPLGNFMQEQVGTVGSSFTRGLLGAIVPHPKVPIAHLKGFQLNIVATNGNSGGPVFSLETGKAFGVLRSGIFHSEGGLIPGLAKADPVYPLFEHTIPELKKPQPPQWLRDATGGD